MFYFYFKPFCSYQCAWRGKITLSRLRRDKIDTLNNDFHVKNLSHHSCWRDSFVALRATLEKSYIFHTGWMEIIFI